MNLEKLERLYPFFAPLILVIIACLQLYLAHVHNLTPWKGGGFGMFSTVDSQKNRYLHCYLLTNNGEVPVKVSHDMRRLAAEIRSIPRRERVYQLANKLLRATWVPYSDDVENDHSVPLEDQLSPEMDAIDSAPPRFRIKEKNESEAGEIVNFYGVRVEVWGMDFDSQHKQINRYKILEVTVEKEAKISEGYSFFSGK